MDFHVINSSLTALFVCKCLQRSVLGRGDHWMYRQPANHRSHPIVLKCMDGSYDVTIIMDNTASSRSLFWIFCRPCQLSWSCSWCIKGSVFCEGDRHGGRAVFIVYFVGNVGVVDVDSGNYGNVGYSSSISKIECWLLPSCSLSRGRLSWVDWQKIDMTP